MVKTDLVKTDLVKTDTRGQQGRLYLVKTDLVKTALDKTDTRGQQGRLSYVKTDLVKTDLVKTDTRRQQERTGTARAGGSPLTTKGYDHKTPIRASFDQRFNRYSHLSLPERTAGAHGNCEGRWQSVAATPEATSWCMPLHLRVALSMPRLACCASTCARYCDG